MDRKTMLCLRSIGWRDEAVSLKKYELIQDIVAERGNLFAPNCAMCEGTRDHNSERCYIKVNCMDCKFISHGYGKCTNTNHYWYRMMIELDTLDICKDSCINKANEYKDRLKGWIEDINNGETYQY